MPTTAVELSIFADDGTETRIHLTNRLGPTWWTFVDGMKPGSRYGFRVTGPGQSPNKLLVDPYAKAIDGGVDWLGASACSAKSAFRPDSERDTAVFSPRSIVVDPRFDWELDKSPAVPWSKTIIYEVHVKGATKQLDLVPEELRGTYAGLAHPAFIEHLQRLGVTTLELLPVHHIGHEQRLVESDLTNYWGYNTLGFFAPHDGYAASGTRGEQVSEFKGMVKLLHRAGFEVLLDVVYNHTPEGGADGPVLCLRGFDPLGWYRNVDTTGCGNTVDMDDPRALHLVLDSLRYWVQEMHVDGFRFDLATALGRDSSGYSQRSRFLTAVAQDPVLSKVKLIAEPWDIGMGGYQVGNFPAPWAEWNDKYRDTLRDFWRNAPCARGEVAQRITGSADLFWESRRRPWTSINFVTAHDGFTLLDLVSFNGKHNHQNGEDNRDGSNDNRSWNGGVEGPTDDAKVNAWRKRQQRNLLATLCFSQGTPMLVAGDEMGRTQDGNNNAYCQDNSISWVDWDSADQELIDVVAHCIALRKRFEILRNPNWLLPERATWLSADGVPMTHDEWNDPFGAGLTLVLHGDSSSLALLTNDSFEEHAFQLPVDCVWSVELSTGDPLMRGPIESSKFLMLPQSLVLLSSDAVQTQV